VAQPPRADDLNVHVYPLSQSQRSGLDLYELVPELVTNPHYTLSVVLDVSGDFDVDRLGDATDALVARQAVLRTRCAEVDDAWVQQVLDHRARPGRSALTVLDAAPAGGPDRASLAAALAAAPVAWDEPPVLRVLVRPVADGHLVALVVHHFFVDARSLHLAVAELARGYDALGGAGPPVPGPTLGYGDYAAWQTERLTARSGEDRAAWDRVLADARPPAYRRDREHVPERAADGRVRRAPLLDREGLAALDTWSRRHRSTALPTLLAAFLRTLATDTDDRDLLVFTAFEQRDHPATGDLLGNFVHPALLRVEVHDDEPWERLVTRTRDSVIDTYGRAQYPVERQLAANLELLLGAMGLTPPWTRFFEYLPPHGAGSYRFGEATATVVESSGHQLAAQDHTLALRCRRTADGVLLGRLGYDANELDDAHAQRLLDHVTAMLTEIAGLA
jgi:hypothetical protein